MMHITGQNIYLIRIIKKNASQTSKLNISTGVSRCIELRKVGEEIWRIKINVPDNKKGQKRPLFFKSDNLQKA